MWLFQVVESIVEVFRQGQAAANIGALRRC